MLSNFHELNYEDFCTDVSNFLKENEKELIEYSVDALVPLASLNKSKLVLKLSEFWLKNY
jgi:dihydroneopterin aldolase